MQRKSRTARTSTTFICRGMALAALLLACRVQALGVEPMVFELEPLGGAARASMSVSNETDTALTVEVVPRKLAFATDGEEILTSADDDILIFPPLAEIPPGTTQVLQVQYIGDPEITSSIAYRVSIEQLPIASAAGGRGMGLASNFHTLLNVVPANASAQLSVDAIEPGTEAGVFLLEIGNSGSRFARLSTTSWIIEKDGETTRVTGRDIRKRASGNLILPNSSREISLSSPDGMDLEGASITIETD